MESYSNKSKIDPPKKKKTGVTMEHKRGEETKTYTPARAHTGDSRYGKENPKNKDAKFIEDARAKKQDIAYDKAGKPYRAGHTNVTKKPDRVVMKADVTIPTTQDIIRTKPSTNTVKKEVKSSGKSKGKLKPMAMTYGTDSPKGGGTKYKNKVRAIRGR